MDTQLALFYQQLQTATNAAHLDKLIGAIDTEIAHTQAQADKYMARSAAQLETDLNSIETKRVHLATTLDRHSGPLITKISNANDLSYKITKKIRLLDQEKDQINAAFRYVQHVTLLKSEILNCSSFLEARNWKQAAQCINNVLVQLPAEMLESDDFVAFMVPTSDLPELPRTTIAQWVAELTAFFQAEFERAAAAKDVAKLTEYFLLFPLLLKADVGLACYSRFVVNLVNEQSRSLLTSVSKDARAKPGFYSLSLLKVFEIISAIVNQHARVIVENYDAASMLQIISRIQKECDVQSGLIFDTFWDAKHVQHVLLQVERYDFPVLVAMMLDTGDAEEVVRGDAVSVLEVNDLCFELANILKNWKMYCNFLKIKWDTYSGAAESNDVPRPVQESSFVAKTRDKIAPTFDELSTFQLRRSIEKSFDMEQLPDVAACLLARDVSAPPVSSTVDDIVLVLSNVLTRTLQTGDAAVIKNMVTNCRRILEVDVIQLLMRRLSVNYPRANASLALPAPPASGRDSSEFSRDASMSPRATTPSNPSNYGSLFMKGAQSAISSAINFSKDDDWRRLSHFVVYLNSVDTLKGYLRQLVDNLTRKLVTDKLFLHHDADGPASAGLYDNSVTRNLANVLRLFGDSLQQKCDAVIADNVNVLYQQVFNQKAAKLVGDLFTNPDEYLTSVAGTNDDLLRFLTQLRALYQTYQKLLAPALFLKLMAVLTGKLSGFVEKKIMGLRFTEVGALALEKNLSYIIGDVSKIDYKLREKFLRVTQMVMVLSLDDDEEDQLFNDDENDEKLGIKWVLTPAERKRVRSLRVDREKMN